MSALQADTYHLFGNLFRFHAHSLDTGGAYCLVETLTAPGAGAPPNRHPDDDEAFYVLDGLFEFMVDGETVQARTGSFVKIPTGAIHAFRNIGPAPGRLLIINAPGRVHDGFFTEAGEAMPIGTSDLPPPSGEPLDISRVVEIGRRNGLEFLLPSGEAR
ncbi:quercetin dioxygenase-like cupin family protein [Rhizobium sp. BK313]|jgi:quercetin dioxygenase-like cupin family protein|uniref:cupin domain-containing protein n=1 Tax=Rhizobium sp. BK313 TaxID=2587081 RepID=UPI00105D4E6F|nr:cupin domain-containing protein [Rhizobium sp. BK313]MBB3452055.1 quercetin dioxygenase-like cupin family protein [Rhizobium sp. BK313]